MHAVKLQLADGDTRRVAVPEGAGLDEVRKRLAAAVSSLDGVALERRLADGRWTPLAEPEHWLAAASPASERVVNFTVNGEAQSVAAPPPTLMLAEYLRRTLCLTGTKIGCGECGCGACTVVLQGGMAGAAPVTANSCVRPVSSLDGASVTTVEALGSPQAGLGKVQAALVAKNGSHCGYCSSGMAMSLHGALLANPKPTAQEMEDALQGNLCRCTGYRPILNAAQSFVPAAAAAAVDIEDVGHGCGGGGGGAAAADGKKKSCGGSGACGGAGKCHKAAAATRRWADEATGAVWVEPASLADVLKVYGEYPAGTRVRLVHGNTGHSVAKYYADRPAPGVYVNVALVPELLGVTAPRAVAGGSPTPLVAGAGVTLAALRAALVAAQGVDGFGHAADMARYLGDVANHQVRNVSSWAGNLAVAAANPGFPSDLRTMLSAAAATVLVADAPDGRQTSLSVLELCAPGGMPRGRVIVSLSLPPLPAGAVYRGFKVAARAQNAHALVNAGLYLAPTDDGSAVSAALLCFGGVTDGLVVASKTAELLVGRAIDAATLGAALPVLLAEVTPPPDAAHPNRTLPSPEFRAQGAAGLFYRFWLAAMAARDPSSVPASLGSAWQPWARGVSSGSEHFTPGAGAGGGSPVGQPVPKVGAPAQVSGQARYTDDVPTPARGLEAAYVLSDRAPDTIKSIDATAALAMPGVVAVLTAHDVAAVGGSNNCGRFPGDEEIFASQKVLYAGQPLGLVCAETREQAELAALAVVIEYGGSGGVAPLVDAEQAIKAGSYLKNNQYLGHIQQLKRPGKDAAAVYAASAHQISGTLSTPASSHFFMETQACLVEPAGDGRLHVWSSTQSPSAVQGTLAAALGVSPSRLVVETSRTGGAFGGKLTRDSPVACAVAVAAVRLGRAVRMQTSRRADLRTMGKRHPFTCEYEAAFDHEGRMQAYLPTFYCVGGSAYDLTMGTSDGAMEWADNCTYAPAYTANAYCLRVNTPPNTAARAPGAMNATFFIESVLERAAIELGLAPEAVREANFYKTGQTTPYGQPIVEAEALAAAWAQLKDGASVASRRASVAAFNKANRWRKRGLRMTTIKYGIELGYFMGVRLNVSPSDGSVVVSTTGVEVGQGLHTKVAQVVAFELGVPLDLVSFESCSTRDFPAFTMTGGSGTSEACAAAAVKACAALQAALEPARKANPKAGWAALAQAAYYGGACLTQQGWYHGTPAASGSVFNYFVYAAACSEVELDVLTGVPLVRRVDIVFNGGESLNYAVDAGQIEGAFVQGLGFFFTERVVLDSSTSRVVNDGTWDYKPPSSQDIPLELNVSFLGKTPNPAPGAVFGSKASGEPPLMLSASAYFALKDCIAAARADAGLPAGYFDLPVPATPDATQRACGVDTSQMTV